jgi:hypothetical protein
MHPFIRYIASGMISTATGILLLSCTSNGPQQQTTSTVRIKNDFNNDSLFQLTGRKPPWTIARCNYRGVEFGKIHLGETSDAQEVEPGLDYVLIVGCYDDTSCSTQNCLPIASKIEEEVVPGQTRTIALNFPNHWGPCPPLGVDSIPSILYNRIRDLYPEFGFMPDSLRRHNLQCQ